MEIVIPDNHVSVFARAIHSLSKIGEELYIHPEDHGLTLKTLNSSRSAFGSFLFAPTFFQLYENSSSIGNGEEPMTKFKLAMKSCLTIFKSAASLEKTVQRCTITLGKKETRLIFKLDCKHGIMKTYSLTFIECETLQAIFSKELCANVLQADTKLLCGAVMNFHNNQEELTLVVSSQKIALKNCIKQEQGAKKAMTTILNLCPGDFEKYKIGVDANITFCFKEFRAFLTFSEFNNLPITLHFETAGRPVIFSLSGNAFEADLVLATLAENESFKASNTPYKANTEKNISQKDLSELAGIDSLLVNWNDDLIEDTSDVSKRCPLKSDFMKPSSSTETQEPQLALSSNTQCTVGEVRTEDTIEVVPSTPPPSKKFRSLFFGFSQSTAQQSDSSQHLSVLAEDTDEEN